jgi:type I restriction enzyme S subunit
VGDFVPIEFHRDGPWDLPEGWVWARLGALGGWMSGGTPKSSVSSYYGGDIPWFRITELNEGRLASPARTLTKSGLANSSAKIIKAPFLMFAMYGASIGKMAISEIDASTNQAIACCRPYEGIDIDYLFWALKFSKQKLISQGQGGAQPNISQQILLEHLIPIAPYAEQRRIVARITELFTDIADGETSLARARGDLDTWRRALLKAAVTGELTREWREDNRSKETGDQRLQKLLAMSKKVKTRARRTGGAAAFSQGDLPELPPTWTWAPLGDLLAHLTSGSRDWASYYDRGSGVFVLAQNVRPGRYNHATTQHVDPPASVETERTRIQFSDILITIVGANTGDVCRVDFEAVEHFVCQSVALLRLKDISLSEFATLALVSEVGQMQFRRFIYGAGRPHLSFDQIESTFVPVPPETEGRAICALLRDYLSDVEDAVGLTQERAAGAQLRQSILKTAFEGRLVAQDSREESADLLLARFDRQVTPAASRSRGTTRRAALAVE